MASQWRPVQHSHHLDHLSTLPPCQPPLDSKLQSRFPPLSQLLTPHFFYPRTAFFCTTVNFCKTKICFNSPPFASASIILRLYLSPSLLPLLLLYILLASQHSCEALSSYSSQPSNFQMPSIAKIGKSSNFLLHKDSIFKVGICFSSKLFYFLNKKLNKYI